MQKSKAYLDLDLDGVRLFLKIDDYVNCANKNDSIYDYLCYTEMYFDFEKSHIRFSPFSDCLFCFEIDILVDMITKHLKKEYDDIEYYECVSPDLYFVFYPQDFIPTKRERIINKELMMLNAKTNSYNCMELYLTFVLNGIYGNHQLKVIFSDEKLQYLLVFLDLVRGKNNIHSEKVQELINKGIIHPLYS